MAGQVLHVHARSSVHLRGVLPGEQGDTRSHDDLFALADDHDSTAEMVKWLASSSGSVPVHARGDNNVFVDNGAADNGTLADADVVHDHRVLDESALVHLYPGEMMERRTVPPEIMVPPETIESKAWPVRPFSSKTNFAGGN